ncbi:hypothetical protein H4Q26_001952 [Puccinia striiformis f. sp. tritici PST-130]|nr:hypothetical protein H4Q26_001952 [Puccinia striiformis f. sp. tritici PST-130]
MSYFQRTLHIQQENPRPDHPPIPSHPRLNLSIGLREKAYSEARERIFGSLSSTPDEQPSASSSSRPITSSKSSALPQTSLDSSSSVNLVGIQRQPNGPISTDQKGFNSRQKIIPA